MWCADVPISPPKTHRGYQFSQTVPCFLSISSYFSDAFYFPFLFYRRPAIDAVLSKRQPDIVTGNFWSWSWNFIDFFPPHPAIQRASTFNWRVGQTFCFTRGRSVASAKKLCHFLGTPLILYIVCWLYWLWPGFCLPKAIINFVPTHSGFRSGLNLYFVLRKGRMFHERRPRQCTKSLHCLTLLVRYYKTVLVFANLAETVWLWPSFADSCHQLLDFLPCKVAVVWVLSRPRPLSSERYIYWHWQIAIFINFDRKIRWIESMDTQKDTQTIRYISVRKEKK